MALQAPAEAPPGIDMDSFPILRLDQVPMLPDALLRKGLGKLIELIGQFEAETVRCARPCAAGPARRSLHPPRPPPAGHAVPAPAVRPQAAACNAAAD